MGDGTTGGGNLPPPTPIRREETNDMREFFARLSRLSSNPATRDQFNVLLDRLVEYESVLDSAIAAKKDRTYDTYTAQRRRAAAFIGRGGHISELVEDDEQCQFELGMYWADVQHSMAGKSNHSHPSRILLWRDREWLGLEGAIEDGARPTTELARELGVHRQTLVNLMEFYADAMDIPRRRRT